YSLEGSLRDIARLDRPAHWFVGTDDTWIRPEEIDRCARANPSGQFKVFSLQNCGHDIGKHAAIAREMTLRIVALCRADDADDASPVEPKYEHIVSSAIAERRIQRAA